MKRTARSLLALLATGAIALGGALVAPSAALAEPTPVDSSTMSWGFLGSWRDYIAGPIAAGGVEAVAPATQSGTAIVYADGTGNYDSSTGLGTVNYAGAMRSYGHLTDGNWVLDQTLANPQIVLTSPTAGTLSFEITQGSYSAFPARTGEREVIADLSFAADDAADGTVTAAATMTDAGASVYGPANANYNPGAPLDALTFTLPIPAGAPEATSITVDAPATVETGAAVSLTAAVTPAAAGTATFTSDRDGELGSAAVDGTGVATLAVGSGLTRGAHQITAAFTPADPSAYLASTSPVAMVTVGDPAAVTTVALTVSPTTGVTAGDAVTLTATLNPADASGTVQFTADTGVLGDPLPVVSGSAKLTTTALLPGTRTLSAQFVSADQTTWNDATSANAVLTVAPAQTGEKTTVTHGDLSWGVITRWWKYVTGLIAAGSVTAQPPAVLGAAGTNSVTWKNQNSGEQVDLINGSGTITYKGTMVSRGHEGHGSGGSNYGLEQKLEDPQIKLTSSQTATLSLLVTQPSYNAFPTYTGQRVVIANLSFASTELAKGVVTARATLTPAGAAVYGNIEGYTSGEELAPVSFSVNTGTAASTGVALTASERSITEGAAVTLTATTTPKNVAGTVTFSRGGTLLAKVKVENGQASTRVTGLAIGDHTLSARFDPADGGYSWSNATTTVTVVGVPVTPPSNGQQQPGSLAWGISSAFASYVTGTIAKGSITTSGVGGSSGAYLFPQAAGGAWNAATQTGSVQYSGTVTFTGHKGLLSETFSNPVITVTGPTSGTISAGGHTFGLDLGSASKSTGANGEVTWTGVPVSGGISGGASGGSQYTLGVDPLSFTVGSVNNVSYGSTVEEKTKPKRTPAATAPTTTGLRVLTDPEKIKAGGRIEIEASGFDANDEGVLVVLYSDPILLDDSAKANADGVVTWQGTLPDDITGEHVITLQGSTDAGAIIEIDDDEEDKKAADAKKKFAAEKLAEQELAAAGIFGGGGTSGMALWEWWASAAGLVVIAACTTTLAVRQRRSL